MSVYPDFPRASASIPCKICGMVAPLCGVTDFSRGGADIQHALAISGAELTHDLIVLTKLDPYAGLPVYYYSCANCLFSFTPAFDRWQTADFEREIYNHDYARHDPGYAGLRQEGWARTFAEWLGPDRTDCRFIDYGSGMGYLERHLQAHGFGSVASFDPFGTSRAEVMEPADIVFLNEVIEHVTDPAASFAEIARLCRPDGVILLTTELVDQAILAAGLVNWWYCVPRAGHVSFFSEAAFHLVAHGLGMRYRRLGRGLHMLHRAAMPNWIAPLLERAGVADP